MNSEETAFVVIIVILVLAGVAVLASRRRWGSRRSRRSGRRGTDSRCNDSGERRDSGCDDGGRGCEGPPGRDGCPGRQGCVGPTGPAGPNSFRSLVFNALSMLGVPDTIGPGFVLDPLTPPGTAVQLDDTTLAPGARVSFPGWELPPATGATASFTLSFNVPFDYVPGQTQAQVIVSLVIGNPADQGLTGTVALGMSSFFRQPNTGRPYQTPADFVNATNFINIPAPGNVITAWSTRYNVSTYLNQSGEPILPGSMALLNFRRVGDATTDSFPRNILLATVEFRYQSS